MADSAHISYFHELQQVLIMTGKRCGVRSLSLRWTLLTITCLFQKLDLPLEKAFSQLVEGRFIERVPVSQLNPLPFGIILYFCEIRLDTEAMEVMKQLINKALRREEVRWGEW